MKKLWKKIRDWWFMNCQKKKDCGVERKAFKRVGDTFFTIW